MCKSIRIILISLFFLSGYSYSEIEIKISVDKNEYLEGENIICNLSFINNSDSPDSLDYDKFGLYYIKIKSPENKEIQYTGGFGCWVGSVGYRKIKPHDSTGSTFILNNLFVDKVVSLSVNSAPGFLTNGFYVVKYNYGERLTSNEIMININQPTGLDGLVFEKLITAYKINDMKHGTVDSIFVKKENYYEIALGYTESIYWEEAVYRYNQECNWLNLAYTDINVNKAFIKRFPNSIYVSHILINLCQSIYHYQGGEQAVTLCLDDLIENYKNYDVSVYAKEQLLKKDYLK
ncbi:MAG: hypothetical protein ABI543_07040 [Ignavibacteria bacterium]